MAYDPFWQDKALIQVSLHHCSENDCQYQRRMRQFHFIEEKPQDSKEEHGSNIEDTVSDGEGPRNAKQRNHTRRKRLLPVSAQPRAYITASINQIVESMYPPWRCFLPISPVRCLHPFPETNTRSPCGPTFVFFSSSKASFWKDLRRLPLTQRCVQRHFPRERHLYLGPTIFSGTTALSNSASVR